MIDSFSGEYRFLSNFYNAEVEYEGKKYPTTEHAFQGAKTHNQDAREAIRLAETPGRAKRLGRLVDIRDDWESVKIDVMEGLLRQKFAEGSELATLLMNTGFRKLVEKNHWGDCFWGVCKGKGENHLGQLLMKLRADLWVTFVEKSSLEVIRERFEE